jgi:hypothetical protein
MSGASPSTPTSDFELDASPAKYTRSHKRTVVSPTPVLESPAKKRRTKADLTDLDVWDKTDAEIISMSFSSFSFTNEFTGFEFRCIQSSMEFRCI